jgi:hypothetical protein
MSSLQQAVVCTTSGTGIFALIQIALTLRASPMRRAILLEIDRLQERSEQEFS